MNPTLERLLDRWRASQSAEAALSLCDAVATAAETGGEPRSDVARGIAAEVGPCHSGRQPVQLAIGRMLLAHGALGEAKRHLLIATRLAPGEPRAPQLLGEALLMQGEAERAARALNAALRAGAQDEACRGWYEVALAYIPHQRQSGATEVARMVAATMGRPFAEEPTRDLPDEPVWNEDSLDDPATMDTRVTAQPPLPSPLAETRPEIIPRDLEPAEEVPLDEGTAIVSMEELREMIERDLEEMEERDHSVATAPTAEMPMELAPTKHERGAETPTVTEGPPASGKHPSPKRSPSAESAPVVEVPAGAMRKPNAESAPVVAVPATALERLRDEASPETEPPTERRDERGGRAGMVILLVAILVGVIVYGLRSGRLPALAPYLPSWMTGHR